jgi:hypothetical protein
MKTESTMQLDAISELNGGEIESGMPAMKLSEMDRRDHRRHDLEPQEITVTRWDGKRPAKPLGQVVDLSAGGIRIRTGQGNSVKVDQQIRVRLELPAYAGISPFVDTSGETLQPKREWVGWMAVNRVQKISDKLVEVAGRLMDMEEIDRGMLGLYLSTHPLAA